MHTLSIRAHLLLLVLIVSGPFVAAIGFIIYADMRQTIAYTKTSLRTLASSMATNTGGRIIDDRKILERLASRSLVMKVDSKNCDGILQELLKLNPRYANVGYSDMNGNVVCSATPLPNGKPVSFAKFSWFQKFMREKHFTVGQPFVGQITGKLVSIIISPIWNERREMTGAVYFSLDLMKAFDPDIPTHLLPDDSHYGFFSEDGTLVWRNVDPQRAIGTRPKAQAAQNIVKVRDGEFESRAADGVTRYYPVLSMPKIGWIAWVGVPASTVYAKAKQRAIVLAVAALVAISLLLFVALAIARRITRPVVELAGIARAVQGGDLGVRATVGGPSDIAAVAREFNAMIDAQQFSVAQLRIAAIVFESQESMMVTDANCVILRINQAFKESTGYTAEEIVGQTPRLLQSGRHDSDFYRAMWDSVKRTGGWQGEIWDRRKNGEVYPKWLTISAVKDGTGAVTHYIGTHFDISERKKAEEKINELAFFDQLTGLANRTLLLDRLKQVMTASSRCGSVGALLLIDLDNFKMLNDTLGHDIGDLLLKQVAQRLIACVRAEDTVARLGGDEFVVMLANLDVLERDAANQAKAISEKIRFTLNQAYQLKEVTYHGTPSIGITLFVGHRVSIDNLLKQADLAMYKSKEAGRNMMHFFDPGMQAVVVERATLEADLRKAIQEHQFTLHYQAQVVDRGVTGAEALLRWKHPQRGMMSPAEFIPLAEETGLILPLGYWVLKTACAQLAVWATQPKMADLTLAVNISARQFRQADFVDQVLAVLHVSGANPQRLKLELTESMLVENVQDIIEKMFALKAKGVGFALDDFGTGYSSLSYLKRLPLDHLKIDQSFVRDILSDPNDAAIARTIVALAQNLGLGVIAEGVETVAQRDFLASVGCYAYQGYFFSRPLPIEGFEEFARQQLLLLPP